MAQDKIRNEEMGYVFRQTGTSTRDAGHAYSYTNENVESSIELTNKWNSDIAYLEKLCDGFPSTMQAYWDANMNIERVLELIDEYDHGIVNNEYETVMASSITLQTDKKFYAKDEKIHISGHVDKKLSDTR